MSDADTNLRKIDNVLDGRFTRQIRMSPSGCWLWLGYTTNGYGRISFRGKRVYLHRLVYQTTEGPIPTGLFVDHRCGIPVCVNPEHLRTVTPKQNVEHLTHLVATNTSGVRGVVWDKVNRKWQAQIQHRGRNYKLGRFETLDDAAAAARAARARMFTHDDGVLGGAA